MPFARREVPNIASKGAAYRPDKWHISKSKNRYFLRQSATIGSSSFLFGCLRRRALIDQIDDAHIGDAGI